MVKTQWKAPSYTAFTPSSTPDSRWWDGSASGLSIRDISFYMLDIPFVFE